MSLRKVLVVDDEKDIVETLASILESTNKYQVTTASNGAEAYVKTRNSKFDIILTDYNMPQSTGTDLLFSLRDHNLNNLTPVIFITGYADVAKEKIKGLENVYIREKPFDFKQLIEMMDKILIDMDKAMPANSPKSPGVDANLINHFANASVLTIKRMTGIEKVSPLKAFLLNNENYPKLDISGFLHMKSNKFVGVLGVSFPKETFLKIMSKMLGQQYTELNEEIDNAAGEITNIIYGQTRLSLEKENYQFEKAIPTVVKGVGHKLTVLEKGPTILIPFDSEFGNFFVIVNIQI